MIFNVQSLSLHQYPSFSPTYLYSRNYNYFLFFSFERLIKAASAGDMDDVVRCVIEEGADTNGSIGDLNPLREAIKGNHQAVVEFLMEVNNFWLCE